MVVYFHYHLGGRFSFSQWVPQHFKFYSNSGDWNLLDVYVAMWPCGIVIKCNNKLGKVITKKRSCVNGDINIVHMNIICRKWNLYQQIFTSNWKWVSLLLWILQQSTKDLRTIPWCSTQLPQFFLVLTEHHFFGDLFLGLPSSFVTHSASEGTESSQELLYHFRFHETCRLYLLVGVTFKV